MKAADLIKLMEAKGWRLEREGKGSHKIYSHPDYANPISVPFHGKKDLGPGLLNKLKKRAGVK